MADGSLPPIAPPAAGVTPFPLRPHAARGLPSPTAAPRACLSCGCTEARACPGGCSWVGVAGIDLCTSCVGHTPASWASFRCDPVQEAARPFHLCLVEALGHGAEAQAAVADILTGWGLAKRSAQALDTALCAHLLAIGDLIDAAGVEGRYVQLGAAVLKFLEERA